MSIQCQRKIIKFQINQWRNVKDDSKEENTLKSKLDHILLISFNHHKSTNTAHCQEMDKSKTVPLNQFD